ncbi:unnamed protein product [Coregonus sp. 'balchen']|nr:unnamed protein product [Coregonus sp. 'balchen']
MDLGNTETASIPTPLPHTDPDESKSVTVQGATLDCGVDLERPMPKSETPPQILWESHPAQTVSISPLANIDPDESESVLKLEPAPCPEMDPENTNSDSVLCQIQEEFDSAQKPSEQRDPFPGLILLTDTDLSFPTVSETAPCLGPELDPSDMRDSEDPISASEPLQIDGEPDPCRKELGSMPRPTPHPHIDSRVKLGSDPCPDTDSENTKSTPPELQGEPDTAEIPSEQPATALTSTTESEVDLASPAASCSVSCVGQPDLCNGMRSENPTPASEPLQTEEDPDLVQIQANTPLPHLDSQGFESVPPHKSDATQIGLQPEQPAPVSLTVKTEPGLSSLAVLYPVAYIRQEPGVVTLQSDSQGRDRILEGSRLRRLQPQPQSLPYFPPIQPPTYSPIRPQQSPSISNGPCPMICHSILIPSCPPLDLPPDFPSYHPQINHNCLQPGPNRPSLTSQLRPNHPQPPPDLQLGPGLPGPLPGMAGSIPGSLPSQPPTNQAWCRGESFSSRGVFENYSPVIRSFCLQYPSLLFTQGISAAVGEWRKLSNYDPGYTGKSSATTSAKETETKSTTRVNQAKDKTQRATKSGSGPRVPHGGRLGKVDIKVLEERALGEYTAAMEALLIDPTGVRERLEVRGQEEEGDEEEEGEGDGECSFTEYLNELCSQREFVTKVEAVLDLQYLSSLLTFDPDTIDLLAQEEAQVDQEMPDVPASVTSTDPEDYTTHTASEGCTTQQLAPSLTEHREALSLPMTSYELQFERHCMSMSSIHRKSHSTPNYDNHNAPGHGPPLFIQTQDGCTVSYLIPPIPTPSPSETFQLATSQDGLFQLQGPYPPPQPGNNSHNAPFPMPTPHLRAFSLPPLPVCHKNYNYHNAPPPQGFFVLPENYSPHPIPMTGQDAFQMCPPQRPRHFVFSEDSPEGGTFVFTPMGDYIPHNAPLPMMMNSPSPFPFLERNQTFQQTQYHHPNNTIAGGPLPGDLLASELASTSTTSGELNNLHRPKSDQQNYNQSGQQNYISQTEANLSNSSVPLNISKDGITFMILPLEREEDGVMEGMSEEEEDSDNFTAGQVGDVPKQEDLEEDKKEEEGGREEEEEGGREEEEEGGREEEEEGGREKEEGGGREEEEEGGREEEEGGREEEEEGGREEEEEGGREEEEEGGREEEEEGGREEEEGGREEEEGVVLSPIQTYPFPSPPSVSNLGPPTPIGSPAHFPLAAYHGGRRMLTDNPPSCPPNLRLLAMAALVHSVSSTPPEGQGEDNDDEGQLNWKPQDPCPFQLSHPPRDRDRVTPPSGHWDGDTPCAVPVQSFIMAVSCSTPKGDPFLDAHLTGWVRDTPNPAGERDPQPPPLWAPASLSGPTEEPQIGEGSLEHRPQVEEGPREDGTGRGMEVEAADKGGKEEWRVIDSSSSDGPNTETSDSFNAKMLDCVNSSASDGNNAEASDMRNSSQASGLDSANVKALNIIDLKVTNVTETNPPDNANTQGTDSAFVQATDTTITEAPRVTNSESSDSVNEKLTDVITATEASSITESCDSDGVNKPLPDSPAIDCVKEFADLSTVPIITQVYSDTESSPPSISSTDPGSALLSDCVSETVEEAYPRMEETWNQPIEGVNLDESMSDSQAPIPGLLHPHSAWDESTPLPLCLDATGVKNDHLQSYMSRDSTRETANISAAHTLLTLGQVEVKHSLTPTPRGSAETEGETVLGGYKGQMESNVERENGVETGEEAEMERKEVKQKKRETESEVETTQTGQRTDADGENTERREREEEGRMEEERNEMVGRLEETSNANPSRSSKRSTRHQKHSDSRRREDTVKTEEGKKEIENEKEVVKKTEKRETSEVAVRGEEEEEVIATENKMEEKTEKKKQRQSRKGQEIQAVNREQSEEKELRMSDKEVFKATTAPNINTDKVKVTLKEPQPDQRQKTEADRETSKQRDEAKDKTEKPSTMTSPMRRARRKSKAAAKGKEESSKTENVAEKEDEAKRTEKPSFIPSPMITTRRKSKATEKEKEKPKPENTTNKVTSVETYKEEDEGKEERSERPSPLITPVTRKKSKDAEGKKEGKSNTKKETGGETEKQGDEESTEKPCPMTSTATRRMIKTRGNRKAEESKKEQIPHTAKKEAKATTPNIYTDKEREEGEDVPTSGRVALKDPSPMTRTKWEKNDVERKKEKEPRTANMEIDGELENKESEKIEKPGLRTSPVTRARRKDVEGKKEEKPKPAEKETGKQGNETKEERTEKSFPITSHMTRSRHAKAAMAKKEQEEETANTAEEETGKHGDEVEEHLTEKLKIKTIEGGGTIENDTFVTNRGPNGKGMKRKAGESGDMGEKGERRQVVVQSEEGSYLGLKKLTTKNRRGLTEEPTTSYKAKIEKVETDAKIMGNEGTTENKRQEETIPASRTKHSEGKREIETVMSPVTERRTGKIEGGKRKGETVHPPIPAKLSKLEEDEPTQAGGHTPDERREEVEPKRKEEMDRARERWSQRVGKR